MEALIGGANQIDNIGDLGLLLWLWALASPKQLKQMFSNLDIKHSLEKYSDARQGKTTELAWFLTGLCHSALVSGENAEEVQDVAIQTFDLLKKNFGNKGIFGHSKKTTLSGMIRGRIGCFADQVYPIYALSMFAKAFGNQEALKIALDCANAICRLQGPFGQWWWHYDSTTGQMLGRYPVYSVHQDGMAPMALFALGDVSGLDFSANICKGVEWITGKNELGINLVEESRNLIWRSFHLKKYRMHSEEILSLAGIKPDKERNNNLKVLYECRPYHLGWLLYAFASN